MPFTWRNGVKMEKSRTTWIDSLKGIAICGIVMVHNSASSLPGLFGKIENTGKNGVQLFFLLSAYLTFVSLERFFNDKNTCYGPSLFPGRFHHSDESV